jgi:hypothetical protein
MNTVLYRVQKEKIVVQTADPDPVPDRAAYFGEAGSLSVSASE